ncbi:MAG: DJ-1/PfpI family protein, partial [Candidatus Nanopelagicales bacterium]|nr:DJ-1/PfpI family protein [Candidatus Nanopelagicales bacterium]
MKLDFLIYDGMDLMDFAGPWEVCLTANRLLERRGQDPAFDLAVVSLDGDSVTSYGGVVVAPTSRIRQDAGLVVPGTIDIASALSRPQLIEVIAAPRELVVSVCTGAFLLAEAGLLEGRGWTTHWEDIDDLQLPGAQRARVVDTGPVITGGGIACGLDIGLALVARVSGSALARLVARQMDYSWDYYGDPSGGTEPLVFERFVACPPERVYELFSTAEGVRTFLGAEADIDARVGGRYEYLFLAEGADGERGAEGCRILALEPDRLMVFSWNSPPGLATRGQHTWVVLSLVADGAGTQVRLAHWGHGQGPEW